MTARSFFVLLFALVAVGCDKNNLASIDVWNEIPFLSASVVQPDSIYLDNLTPVNGAYSVSLIVSTKINFPGANQVLTATVVKPTVSESVASTILSDDGQAPDQVAHDSIYTGRLAFTIQRAFAGRYHIQFLAQTPDGAISNLLEKTLKLTRRNSSPIIGNVSSLDSISLPMSGYITVQFTATVSDSDGLADIQQVFFRRISPVDSSNTKFYMRDDGGLGGEIPIGGINLKSGDEIAGDGKFSFLIPVTPTSARRTNVFAFHAIDSFGDTSNVVQRSFTIR